MKYYRIRELDTAFDGELVIDEIATASQIYKQALTIYKDAVEHAKQENKTLLARDSHRRLIVCLEQIEAESLHDALYAEPQTNIKEYTGGLKQ